MRILGIDPGSAATGYGVVERAAGRVVHVAHGTLRVAGRGTRASGAAGRLARLHAALEDVVRAHAPDAAAVEAVFVSANPRSALVLGQARGTLLAVLGRAGLPVAEYDTRTVKQAIAGSGGADKRAVQEMVRRSLALERTPGPDAADALAVALCHAHAGRLVGLGVGAGVRGRGRRRPSAAGWVVRRAR